MSYYFGHKKPFDCNEFLHDFVNETKILLIDGFEYRGKHISVSIYSLIIEISAKFFATATKGYRLFQLC